MVWVNDHLHYTFVRNNLSTSTTTQPIHYPEVAKKAQMADTRSEYSSDPTEGVAGNFTTLLISP